MSFNEEMREKKRKQKPPILPARDSSKSGYGRLVSFSPTKEQKQEIKTQSVPLDEILDFLSTYLQDGHKLSIQYHLATESYFWLLREGHREWNRAAALSAWHVDYHRAGQMLYHALHTSYNQFPVLGLEQDNIDLEW